MEIVPPKALIKKVGSHSEADYRQIGQHFLEIFRTHGGLKPTDRVLDVGCGCGRMAVALAGYLTPEGQVDGGQGRGVLQGGRGRGGGYEGFDVMPELVRWCQAEITPRMPAFRFQVADLYNKTYNPRGKVASRDYRFPYGDGEFDFAFLTSVFTHMMPVDVEQYVRELVRVLRPGGRALMTFFLLNDESLRLKDTRASKISLKKPYLDGQVMVMKRWKPEAAVGYPEGTVREVLARNGLRVREPILYGVWCGRAAGVSLQDIVVAERA